MLREELRLLPAAPGPDGQARVLVHDPVAGRYHRLGDDALHRAEEPEVETFLRRAKLVRGGLPPEALAREELAGRPTLGQLLVHKYLFFRIPLTRPERFLRALRPWTDWLFHRAVLWTVAAMGAVGLVLAGRQWDDFVTTFTGFLTPQGLMLYGLTLAGLKVLHELGHGLVAQRFGVRVPVMGLAFLVMFPVLYTDTTGAWELRSRRERMLIDAGGVITELLIACLAVFAWSFLPDGAMRQVAFFVATTSWTLSLLVNLNPCMRFDGYYLVGDALGVANLQNSSFAFARWRMREWLFGLREPSPPLEDAGGRGLEAALLTYAFSTWVYRFFLFIGIALLVHHIFPTALGITLFIVEIGMFIALPMHRELKQWWTRRAAILRIKRGRTTLAVSALALAALFAPLGSRVSAPALLVPSERAGVFASAASDVAEIHVHHGDRVEAGQLLLSLRSPELLHMREVAELGLAAARAEFARAEATDAFRNELEPLRDAVGRAEARLAGAEAELERLDVRAPVAGIVERPGAPLRLGETVGPTTALLHIRGGRPEAVLRLSETAAARVSEGGAVRVFTADGMREGRVRSLAPTSRAVETEDAFASVHGGPLAVDPDEDGMVLRNPAVDATVALDGPLPRGKLGTAWVDARRESVGTRILRRVRGVLLREFDF